MNDSAIPNNSWLLIPFYSNPNLETYSESVIKFRKFAKDAKAVSGLKLAIVDDGSDLNPEDFLDFTDRLIQLPVNGGKAVAVRQGLHTLLTDDEERVDFIVQYDGDGDQSFTDIPLFASRIHEHTEGDPTKPVLLIGDRYSDRLVTPPNPDSVAYRESILIFLGAIAKQFDYDVRDWVSGARAYTRDFAQKFLDRSVSDRYGIEAEQLVIAYLENAEVGNVALEHSRPRDSFTEGWKLLQSFDMFLAHGDELRNKGKNPLVDTLTDLTAGLRALETHVEIDLHPLGESTSIRFDRINETAYTAEIPEDFRMQVFSGESPFSLRKERMY